LYAQWSVKSLFISGRVKKLVGDNTEASKAPQWGRIPYPPVILALLFVIMTTGFGKIGAFYGRQSCWQNEQSIGDLSRQ